MAAQSQSQSQSSPIPSNIAPCPTCSCPRSHSHSQPQPQPEQPLSSPIPKTLTLNSTQPKLDEAPRSRLCDALRFPQPRLLDSSTPPPPAQPESAVVSGSPPPDNAADLTASSSNPNSLLECKTFKSRLHTYAQRSSIPIPEYKIVNEGLLHAPRFRSSVDVDGVTYTSQNTFSHRKAAEQDVAKLAMECISKKIKNEGCPLIHEDTVFCKSILNEFAVKMNLPTVTYKTVRSEALIPIFTSSLVVNGITYMGDPKKNKKEAEQMAARAAIISLMGDSGFGTALSEIVKSKEKLYNALYKKPSNNGHESIVPAGGNAESDIGTPHTQNPVVDPSVPTMCKPITDIEESPVVAASTPISAVSQPIGTAPSGSARVEPPRHEFRVPKQEISSGAINPPAETVLPNVQRFIAFTPPAQQPVGAVPDLGSKRRRHNKKRSSKKARVGVGAQ